MSPDAREAYVIGVVDDWVHTVQMAERSVDVSRQRQLGMDALSVSEELLARLVKCVTDQGMRYSQIIEAVDKYLDNHPAEVKFEMSSHLFVAMAETCQLQKDMKK